MLFYFVSLNFHCFHLCCSKDGGAPVVHGATHVQDHHHQQVQEEAGAAHGLPEDVSFWSPQADLVLSW